MPPRGFLIFRLHQNPASCCCSVTLSSRVRFGGSPQSIHPSWIGLFRVREWAPRDKFVPRVFWCLKSHVNNRILNIWWTERVWHETDLYPDLISGHLNRAVASWVGEMLVPNWVPAPTYILIGYTVAGDHESKGAPKLSAPIPISDTSPSGYLVFPLIWGKKTMEFF